MTAWLNFDLTGVVNRLTALQPAIAAQKMAHSQICSVKSTANRL
jgi:hypothetical protein